MKIKKTILVVINLVMLVFACIWYYNEKSYEPVIVVFGQIASLITLSTSDKKSDIKTKRIKGNANVDLDVQSGDNVHASDIEDDAKVNVRTR